MGLFGTYNWMIKDHTSIIVYAVLILVLSGRAGALTSLFVVPFTDAKILSLFILA